MNDFYHQLIRVQLFELDRSSRQYICHSHRKSMYAREIISSLTNLCSEINCHLDHLLSNNRTSSQLGQQDTSFLIHSLSPSSCSALFFFLSLSLAFSRSLFLFYSFLFLYLHIFSLVEQTLVDHQRTYAHTHLAHISEAC